MFVLCNVHVHTCILYMYMYMVYMYMVYMYIHMDMYLLLIRMYMYIVYACVRCCVVYLFLVGTQRPSVSVSISFFVSSATPPDTRMYSGRSVHSSYSIHAVFDVLYVHVHVCTDTMYTCLCAHVVIIIYAHHNNYSEKPLI